MNNVAVIIGTRYVVHYTRFTIAISSERNCDCIRSFKSWEKSSFPARDKCDKLRLEDCLACNAHIRE